MYHVGDRVVYGIHGVCVITDLLERTIDRKRIRYFVLEPLSTPGAQYFVPSENAGALSKLRRVIDREELDALLENIHVDEQCWIADENRRKQMYRDLIGSGDWKALLQMIGVLHVHKEKMLAVGRKFHLCDENFLRDSEKLLTEEFALVLEIPPQDVPEYIRSALVK